ncbi:S9 family peptidase [Carboxylicivirga linearis]|uniref:S9 family peptidase n=1 Tax=Carboxylicivirga linearis TaxID=1628157 RepID=A0ABS5JWV3_9BACT|nr:S9 family peptidase [Carboxylicivirga linearis]MBS2099304.1 S9 family peptidase [Carboxylicivirga linearis]
MKTPLFKLFTIVIIAFTSTHYSHAQESLSPEDLLSLKTVRTNQLSPDGSKLIYTIYTPRTANEKAGGAHHSYMVMDLKTKETHTLFNDDDKHSSPKWNVDGKLLAFTKKVDGTNQVFIQNESREQFQVTHSATGVSTYQWSPMNNAIAYIVSVGKTEKQKELAKRGYDFIFYEEDIINNQLWLQKFDNNFKPTHLTQVTSSGNVWDFEFDKQGKQIAYSSSDLNLIDQKYMFRKLNIYNIESNSITHQLQNEGKLGHYSFSPDGTKLTYSAALNINDHSVSQAYIYDLNNQSTINITPNNYKGHISWADWKNNKELIYMGEEGVNNKLYSYSLKKEKRSLLLNSSNSSIIFSTPLFTSNFSTFVFTGTTPYDASNIYIWDGKKELTKATDINPILSERLLGEQEVIKYNARDGLEIEGLLIKPTNYEEDKTYPLILFVHGGPESHHTNGWLSRYSTPGQVMAGKGYLVAYINYRASTGYGVDFGMHGFEDPAGTEFDDLADAIDYLVEEKGADRNRVGMAGGSYGGYASAWFATYYTNYVKAVGMFVGISDIISKRGTTDIPYEELYVHSGKPLEEMWEISLKRSPIYYAHQSKTATLIYGGAADPRVHPTQSYELYRRMKMNNHPAVRLVQYPGEGHGNRKQVGQIDVLYRQIAWMDWYVRDLKPLDGPMPPLDISDQYGLDW